MAKNQSLPAHLQEKDSRGKDHLTLYEHREKPTTWRSGPSLSNPRFTNDIVWAFLRANPTQLGSLRIVSLQYMPIPLNKYCRLARQIYVKNTQTFMFDTIRKL